MFMYLPLFSCLSAGMQVCSINITPWSHSGLISMNEPIRQSGCDPSETVNYNTRDALSN